MLSFHSHTSRKIIRGVTSQKLTYLDDKALRGLFDAVTYVENNNIQGSILEMGCALGGSAIVIAAAKNKQRHFATYDVFSMIPPPSSKDGQDIQNRYDEIKSGSSAGIGGDTYYGYQENLKQTVENSLTSFGFPLSENNIELIEGLYEDTLQTEKMESIALAHIDCDWYDSVMVCLERIVPKLHKGSILVIDDYDAWSGCKDAIDDYFSTRKSDFDFTHKSRLHITKNK